MYLFVDKINVAKVKQHRKQHRNNHDSIMLSPNFKEYAGLRLVCNAQRRYIAVIYLTKKYYFRYYLLLTQRTVYNVRYYIAVTY